jgi:hypothetical protein
VSSSLSLNVNPDAQSSPVLQLSLLSPIDPGPKHRQATTLDFLSMYTFCVLIKERGNTQ